MATTSGQKLLENILQYKNNPSGIQKAIAGMVKEISNGVYDVVDVTNPFVMLMEAAATVGAASMIENQTLTRKNYPFAAQIVDDLYPHMSDKDYVDRFAVPTTTKIWFLFSMEELLEKLVTEPATGIKKIVIPRNTYVTVADTVFSLQYPIEIRQMAHGGLQVVYNVEQTSPLQTLATNVIEFGINRLDSGEEFMAFEVLAQQFSIVSRTAPINTATGFLSTIPITTNQQYYYCRVWIDEGDGTFTEMPTTHTDDIYDVTTPTAVLRVLDGEVQVRIPQIYLSTNLINKSVRMDMYETFGPLTLNLQNYAPDQFTASFRVLNSAEQDEFVAPLATMRSTYVFSRTSTTGGRDAMTFEELRERVIKNAIGSPSLPITNVQVESTLERAGYSVVKNIDTITNRTFLATRSMPDPTVDSELITAAAAGIGTLSTKTTEAVLIDTVVDNGDWVTITPETLYRVRNGVLELVPNAEVQTVKALPPDKLAIAVTDGNYLYSPFHYVLDATNNQFNVRPYYLDKPLVETKSFIAENDTTLLQVSTNAYVIERTETGYRIQIQTRSSDTFKELEDEDVFVQLAFTPLGESERAYVLGTLINTIEDERVYEFEISTNYKINSDHEMTITNFFMFNQTPREVELPLFTTFDVLYSTSVTMGAQWAISEIDSKLGLFQLPPSTVAITHEQLKLRLGYHLEHLWARARSVVSEENYEKWATDVPALYEADVYERDPVTGASFSVVAGELVYNILFNAGDPVEDGNGDPVYKHRIGDIKHDSYGNPIVISTRSMLRQMDLFMVEGSYYFATNQVSIDYRQILVDEVVVWLTQELPTMGDNLLEQTELYYYPTTTVGTVEVMYGQGLLTQINAGQSFQVTLYVRNSVYSSSELRSSITRKTIQTIGEALERQTISISDIVDELRTQYQDDVISLDVKGLGGAANLNVVTLTNDSNRLSIRKKLVSRSDETMALEESVIVDFVRYERATVR